MKKTKDRKEYQRNYYKNNPDKIKKYISKYRSKPEIIEKFR